tara:strand:- start:4183 stop:5391 length:1209 start_codon:yes stop_codon:yes gene_type:complete
MAAKLWIQEGSRADPIGKKGIHQILSSTIIRGCGPYDNNQLADIVESSGASLNCDTYEDGLLISLKCIEIDAYKLLPLIGWMITKPLLEKRQIELEKDLTINSIKRQKESTYQLAYDGWRKMVYGEGPYGHDPLGSIDDISNINRKDLAPIAKSLIHRKKNLVISGKFPIDIETYLKDLTAYKKIFKIDPNKYYETQSIKTFNIINNPKNRICTKAINTQQVILLLGKATVPYKNEADLLLRLISCYLGYGMSSILFKVLREKYGVVYEAGIYHPIRENQTPFVMHASTTEEKASLTIKLLQECWTKTLSSDISSEELEFLKIKYRGQIAHSLQSISQKAEYKAHLLGIGLKKDHDKELLLRLESISSKEIRKAANKYLNSPSLSVISNKEIIKKISKYWNI